MEQQIPQKRKLSTHGSDSENGYDSLDEDHPRKRHRILTTPPRLTQEQIDKQCDIIARAYGIHLNASTSPNNTSKQATSAQAVIPTQPRLVRRTINSPLKSEKSKHAAAAAEQRLPANKSITKRKRNITAFGSAISELQTKYEQTLDKNKSLQQTNKSLETAVVSYESKMNLFRKESVKLNKLLSDLESQISANISKQTIVLTEQEKQDKQMKKVISQLWTHLTEHCNNKSTKFIGKMSSVPTSANHVSQTDWQCLHDKISGKSTDSDGQNSQKPNKNGVKRKKERFVSGVWDFDEFSKACKPLVDDIKSDVSVHAYSILKIPKTGRYKQRSSAQNGTHAANVSGFRYVGKTVARIASILMTYDSMLETVDCTFRLHRLQSIDLLDMDGAADDGCEQSLIGTSETTSDDDQEEGEEEEDDVEEEDGGLCGIPQSLLMAQIYDFIAGQTD